MPPPGDGFAWQARRLAARSRFGKNNRLQRPNNSLKPSPLRGLVAVWQAYTPRRGRYAPRLSSGVRPVQKQMPVNKRKARLTFVLPSRRPGVWFSPQTPCRLERRHSVSGFGLFAKSGFSAQNSDQTRSDRVKAPAGTGLTIRSSRVRFAASDHGSYD